jgi:ribonuclease P/MRP protein subunit POP8
MATNKSTAREAEPAATATAAATTTGIMPAKRPQSEASIVLHSSTLRRPQWTYFHLSAFSTANEPPSYDAISTRQNLSNAMKKFLGLTGSSIPIDILKIEGSEVWLRVPRDNSRAFHEGVSAWIGKDLMKYLIRDKDDWLSQMSAGNGQDLF